MDIMNFVPPRCPNRRCRMFRRPEGRFFVRTGSYRPKCRNHSIPRFLCRSCGNGFSYQSFRADFGDHRPHDNTRLFELLASGVGFRQAGRLLRMDVHAVQMKFRKQSRHLRRLTRNFTRLPAGGTYVFDEVETYEQRSIAPVTVPVMVERHSKFVVAATAGSIRRRARRGSRRERWLAKHERIHGRRRDRSRRAVLWLLRRFRTLLGSKEAVLLSDEKASYQRLKKQLFGERVPLITCSSRLRRDTYNPLFAVNLTEAMLRDNCGRLRRRSWLVSKRVGCLRRQLDLFAAYRNWHRKRHNSDPEGLTPGVALGVIERGLSLRELHSWRQDWKGSSIHPISVDGSRMVAREAA